MPFRSDDGVKIEFLGDSGPFSRQGVSICYKVTYNGGAYLIDCGAAVFSALTPQTIQELRGIVGTHSHEDHRRWFVDLALFRFYVSRAQNSLRLIATETLLEEYVKTCRAGLERTLSMDSKQVQEVPFTTFVEPIIFGPTARYRILRTRLPGEEGSVWRVMDENGETVAPDQAKVVVHPEANRPRMLFRDFDTRRWVEPESFYPFTETRFYTEDHHSFVEPDIGLTFDACKATAWHGPATNGIRVSTGTEKLFFSSDTVFDPKLYKELATEVREQKLDRPQEAFDQAHILYGEINDYLEQAWSTARYERALKLYAGHVVLHDVAGKNSIVHTDYEVLAALGHEKLLLTHSPDRFVSEFVLTRTGKALRVIGDDFFEEVDGELWEFDADVYYKDSGRYYVGYKAPKGTHKVFVKDGILDIVPMGTRIDGETVMRVNLYADVHGHYLLPLPPDEYYQIGADGRIYHVIYTKNGGRMKTVRSIRGEVPELQRRRRKVHA